MSEPPAPVPMACQLGPDQPRERGDYVGPVHFPYRDLPVSVLQQDVGLTVTIEVAGPGNMPTRPRISHGSVGDYVGPVHFPYRDRPMVFCNRIFKSGVGVLGSGEAELTDTWLVTGADALTHR
jgi:hypothetical protein